MRIAVFGMGYVGVVTAACLAREGHEVIGVDVVHEKVDAINAGKSPIVEAEIGDLIEDAVRQGRLCATVDAAQALDGSRIAIVCVGTPSRSTGEIDTQNLETVATEIGTALRESRQKHLIVFRSTMMPGTTRNDLCPLIESASGHRIGEQIDVAFHPEFLREGTSVYDFLNPPKIVVGEMNAGSAQPLMDLYTGLDAPRFVTSVEVAEAVKYADNAFHALKVTFANEIGEFCRRAGTDSREVMNIFTADTKLNISEKYFRPGFAFGGSCLPKDLRALTAHGQATSETPMLASVMVSNLRQIERTSGQIASLAREAGGSVGIVGLAFKSGTDDIRESPLAILAERLIGKGIKLVIYDDCVNQSRLVGGNKAYVDLHLPHLADTLVSDIDDLDKCDLIVIGHSVESSQINRWLSGKRLVFDLIGDADIEKSETYRGLYW